MIQALALTLVCYGASDVATSQTMTTTSPGAMGSLSSTIHGRERSDDVLVVEINGDTARVKAPRSIQPTLSGTGADGWRDLTELQVSDREIRGRFSFNWINKPLVIIDRMTGLVEIRGGDVLAGTAGFRGRCEPQRNTEPLF